MNTYNGVEVRKLPDGPISKSYTRGIGFSGVCSGSKSARRSNTLGDHVRSKITSSIKTPKRYGKKHYKQDEVTKVSGEKKLVSLTKERR